MMSIELKRKSRMDTEKLDLSGNFSYQTTETLFEIFKTSPKGLTEVIAEERLRLYGLNEFAKTKKKTIQSITTEKYLSVYSLFQYF